MNVPKVQRMAPHVRFPFGVRGAVFSIMVVGLAGAMITAFTGAVFTDTATSSANTFTSGAALAIRLTNGASGTAAQTVTASLSSTGLDGGMLPGDSVYGNIKVTNSNSYDIRYAVTSLLTGSTRTISGASAGTTTTITTTTAHGLNNLDTVMITGSDSTPSIDGTYTVSNVSTYTFDIPVHVVTPGTTGTVTLPGTSNLFAQALRTKVYTGVDATNCAAGQIGSGDGSGAHINSTVNEIDSGGTGTAFGATNLIGDPTVQTNPSNRVLTTSTPSENLCFNVTLPVDADNSVAGLTATAAWSFVAEQVRNNP